MIFGAYSKIICGTEFCFRYNIRSYISEYASMDVILSADDAERR
jgi:hypothetical protein